MKKTLQSLLVAFATIFLMTACTPKTEQAETANDTVIVYMTHEVSPEALVKIYDALGCPAADTDRVAVKISTGESGGHNYLKPELIAQLVKHVNGTIVECNTAYAGSRNTSEAHWKTIKEHGFLDIAKVDIMDEEGEMQIPVTDTTHMKYNLVGSHLPNYTYMVNLAHFKGHAMAGFGGVLKNASIGVASTNGKLYIHSAGMSTDMAEVWSTVTDPEKFEQDLFTESMAAAAQSVHNFFGERKIVYIDVMNNISIDCDCDSHPADPELRDMGILASLDPVAVDQACLDLINAVMKEEGNNPDPLKNRISDRKGTHIIDHAVKIGLGTKVYKLVVLD